MGWCLGYFPCCCDAIPSLEQFGVLFLANNSGACHVGGGIKAAELEASGYSVCSQEAEREKGCCLAGCILLGNSGPNPRMSVQQAEQHLYQCASPLEAELMGFRGTIHLEHPLQSASGKEGALISSLDCKLPRVRVMPVSLSLAHQTGLKGWGQGDEILTQGGG